MSQNHQDIPFNNKQLSQDIHRKDNAFHFDDEASIENEAIAEEPLSIEELANFSGGANEEFRNFNSQEITYHPLGGETNPFEPGPTFPAPPHPETFP